MKFNRLVLIPICCVSCFLSSCGKNDRLYTKNELIGSYRAPDGDYHTYGNGNPEWKEYYLTISDNFCEAYYLSTNYLLERSGNEKPKTVMASGKLSITEKNIFIGSAKGYVQTVSGKIQIIICKQTFTKK